MVSGFFCFLAAQDLVLSSPDSTAGVIVEQYGASASDSDTALIADKRAQLMKHRVPIKLP